MVEVANNEEKLKANKKIFVGLPCYNEEKNIGILLDSWLDLAEDLLQRGYELILRPVDDKSSDNTKGVLEAYANKYSNIKPIYHKENKNLGGGLNSIINSFLADCQRGDLLAVMDGDYTHLPIFSLSMIDKLAYSYDIVIASRYRKGSEIHGLSKFREFMSIGARIYYSLVLGIKGVRDYTCGYRIYTYEILEEGKNKYKDNLVQNTSFACMMELLYKLYKSGAKIAEVPFVLRYDNKEGESKMNVGKTSKDSILSAIKLRFGK